MNGHYTNSTINALVTVDWFVEKIGDENIVNVVFFNWDFISAIMCPRGADKLLIILGKYQ